MKGECMREKRDILFLCQYFYPEYVSSATLPYDTAAALRDAGYTVDVLCGTPKEYFSGGPVPRRETKDGIRIHRLGYLQLGRRGRLSRLINYFSFTLMVLLRFFELAGHRVIIVYSNPPVLPWAAALAKRAFREKLVFVAYDLYPEAAIAAGAAGENGLASRVMRHINRVVFTRVDRVVALSEEMRDFIRENRPVDGERVVVAPNWYRDEGGAGRSGARNRFSESAPGSFVVSYFGNMGVMQDMDTILDAVRLLKDDPGIRFLFAGHGGKLETLRRAAAREGLENMTVLDFLHGRDFQDALESSDCAIVSLIPGAAGLCAPSKTYSYMMRGLPLLAVMGDSDVVRDAEAGAGIHIENGDGAGLAAAIRRLRDHPEELRTMRARCRSIYLQNYTTQIGTKRYVELINGLVL